MTANLFDQFIQTDLQSHGVTQNQIECKPGQPHLQII